MEWETQNSSWTPNEEKCTYFNKYLQFACSREKQSLKKYIYKGVKILEAVASKLR